MSSTSQNQDSNACQHGCKGTRHLWDEENQRWQKCMCLLIQQRDAICQQARIPEEYWGLTVDRLNGFSPALKLAKNQLLNLKASHVQSIKIRGAVAQTKISTYLLLKAFLLKRRGMYASLDEVVTWFLTNDKREFNRLRNSSVLALYFGDEYTQQVHKHILNHLIEYRQEARFKTIWATRITARAGVMTTYGFDFDASVPGEWVNLPDEPLL